MADQTMAQNVAPFDRIEAQAFRKQEIAFCVLTLFVVAALLLLHTHFSVLLGEPSPASITLLFAIFLAKLFEILWLLTQDDGISERTARIESAVSIASMFALAGILAVLTARDETPYFVLLALAILQCAYHFGLLSTVLTVIAAVGMLVGWTQFFFAMHPPPRPTEFLEIGMISVIYAVMGISVWSLVDQLRKKQTILYRKIDELASARESLAQEEKLAAVGRLASGIAHEIRNPVAMIVSSLATAAYPDPGSGEREEMFEIASREAKRLEALTSDFLSYARPSAPQRIAYSVNSLLQHVANATRLRAGNKSIQVEAGPWDDDAIIEVDALQVEGALVNLCLNAVDATPEHGSVALRSRFEADQLLVEIENSGAAIPCNTFSRIFEPFFTTKTGGTGLGLAIARGIARAHGGDIWVSHNQDDSVIFTMSIKTTSATAPAGEEHG